MKGISCALGLDLGLNTGWALVRVLGAPPCILGCGNLDVRSEDGLSARLLAWHAQLVRLCGYVRDNGGQGAAYEEIRRNLGGGANYILMQEGIINVALPETFELGVVGVGQGKLRSFAGMRPSSKSNPVPPTWAKRSIDVFSNPSKLKSQDQAVAAFAAYWLCDQGEVVGG